MPIAVLVRYMFEALFFCWSVCLLFKVIYVLKFCGVGIKYYSVFMSAVPEVNESCMKVSIFFVVYCFARAYSEKPIWTFNG